MTSVSSSELVLVKRFGSPCVVHPTLHGALGATVITSRLPSHALGSSLTADAVGRTGSEADPSGVDIASRLTVNTAIRSHVGHNTSTTAV